MTSLWDNAIDTADVLVVGGGPAGLTAAIYLARFHLEVVVVDRGGSRAALIPKARNHAGFPEGISGADLVDRMRRQAALYGARLIDAEVTGLEKDGSSFAAALAGRTLRARSVLLATGVSNHRPDMDQDVHDSALHRGLLRYCPICDGFEVTDRRVAVIGTGDRGLKEALFLRSYTSDITLIAPTGRHDLSDRMRSTLATAEIAIVDGPAQTIKIIDDAIRVVTPVAGWDFDSVYPALGSTINSGLAAALGAQVSEEGCMIVDAHQRTEIEGLYAAGDVVLGLDQISHAMGEGGVAATAIRNDLADRLSLLRGSRA